MRFVGDKGSFVKHTFNLETHFEKKIYKYSEELFRGSSITRWAPLLIDRLSDEGVKPDSLIVSHNLHDWWVVEVELARRSKLNDMRDQTGKLSRVNYSLHQVSIKKGLRDMGLPGDLEEISKRLSSTPPKFLLIIDEDDENFRREAAFNGFSTLVIEPFATQQGNIRFRIPSEQVFTVEQVVQTDKDIMIKPIPHGQKPLVAGGVWHCEFARNSFADEVITILSPDGSFNAQIIRSQEHDILRLPTSHSCVMDILKGNKTGVLSPSELEPSIFKLNVKWDRL